MGRSPVKGNKSVYQRIRENLGLTREKEAELVHGFSPERLKKLEPWGIIRIVTLVSGLVTGKTPGTGTKGKALVPVFSCRRLKPNRLNNIVSAFLVKIWSKCLQ